MSTLPRASRVQMTLSDDPRAISAAGGAVDNVAQRSGLPPDARKELVAAAEAACRAAFRNMADHDAAISVAIDEYPGRMEIIVEHSGAAATSAGDVSKTFRGLDRVQRETSGGVSRLILIKNLPHS